MQILLSWLKTFCFLQAAKFNKIAKELHRKNPGMSTSELNQSLQQQMDMTTEIWLPPI